MFRRFCAVLLLLVLAVACACAEPMRQAEDYTGSLVIPYDERDSSAGSFTFSYRYPHIDESETGANIVNSFYLEQMDMNETNMLFFADGYAESGETVVKDITYEVRCNDDRFFSVLIIQELRVGENRRVIWEGNTFSRSSKEVGTVYDLPRMLGILDESEQDEFLIDRQTEKASDVVLELMMDMIYENPDHLPYHRNLTFEQLSSLIYPQEDFFLDENGNPVFYAEPGTVADESAGYMVFPIPLEDILDEL